MGLGTDGIAVTGQDMFECMKQSVLLQRAHTGDPVASTVEEAMELATREGARYAGIDAGVLAPGRLADVAVVNLSNVHTRPVHRTVAALVYSARASDVEMTDRGRPRRLRGRALRLRRRAGADGGGRRAGRRAGRPGRDDGADEPVAPAARSASTWSGCGEVAMRSGRAGGVSVRPADLEQVQELAAR